MTDVLCLDYDGTLVRPYSAAPLPGARAALRRHRDRAVPIAVCTNLSGPILRFAGIGGTRYHTLVEEAQGLDAGLRAVGLAPDRLAHLLIATWPGAAWRHLPVEAQPLVGEATELLTEALRAYGWVVDAECAPHWRKPAPGMLQDLARRMEVRVEDICYVGDRDSDRLAAEGAGCRFLAAQAWWR